MRDSAYSGQLLYHYTNLNGLHGILKNRYVRSTAIQDLADETELIYGRDLLARQFEREAKFHRGTSLSSKLATCAECTRAFPNISELIRIGGYEPISNDAKFEWYIACFSEVRDALPLWSSFTSQCTGYALGLRYKRNQGDFVHYPPERVIYSQNKQRNLVREIVADAIDLLLLPESPETASPVIV